MTIGPVTESQSRAFIKAAFEQDLPTLQTHVSTYGRQIVNVSGVYEWKTSYACNALMLAILGQSDSTNYETLIQVTEFLLKNGLDPNAQTVKGHTALHGVFNHLHSDHAKKIVRVLLEHHADPSIEDEEHRLPIDRLTNRYQRSYYEDFFSQFCPNFIQKALVAAKKAISLELMDRVLKSLEIKMNHNDKEAFIDLLDHFPDALHAHFSYIKGAGSTIVEFAILGGKTWALEILLERGATIPETALSFTLATPCNDLNIVKLLLNHGVNPNQTMTHPIFNEVPIWFASAVYGELDIFLLFLKFGIDLNTKVNGYTLKEFLLGQDANTVKSLSDTLLGGQAFGEIILDYPFFKSQALSNDGIKAYPSTDPFKDKPYKKLWIDLLDHTSYLQILSFLETVQYMYRIYKLLDHLQHRNDDQLQTILKLC